MGIILAIVCFIVVMYLDVNSDYKRLETNTIKHGRGLIVRVLGLLSSFGCLLFPLDNLTWQHIGLKSIVIIGLLGSWWWEFFDGWLNTKRDKSWRYNGSDDPNDATTDNWLQELSPPQQMWLKWGLIILFTILYILICK